MYMFWVGPQVGHRGPSPTPITCHQFIPPSVPVPRGSSGPMVRAPHGAAISLAADPQLNMIMTDILYKPRTARLVRVVHFECISSSDGLWGMGGGESADDESFLVLSSSGSELSMVLSWLDVPHPYGLCGRAGAKARQGNPDIPGSSLHHSTEETLVLLELMKLGAAMSRSRRLHKDRDAILSNLGVSRELDLGRSGRRSAPPCPPLATVIRLGAELNLS